ncbi:MAG: 50S ribosomal protein L3 [Chloroflexi bacterium]|jgi:large subunit ribosomal protein L3|nr:50S ribosomal protein L3 [Chloroflexota bacterium]
MRGILGKKVGMTQVFREDGSVVPVTVIEAGPCYVTQLRTEDRDGYRAVQLGYEPAKEKHLTMGQMGHLDRAGVPPLRYLREIRIREDEAFELGQEVQVDIFEPGERVDVVGKSKGRGFAGVVKRYGFAGGPKTHGQSDRLRAPGSVGACASPGRVWKGQRMPGRMGGKRVTSQNIEVVLVDPDRNLLAVKGSVPGPKGGFVIVKEARKQRVRKGGIK